MHRSPFHSSSRRSSTALALPPVRDVISGLCTLSQLCAFETSVTKSPACGLTVFCYFLVIIQAIVSFVINITGAHSIFSLCLSCCACFVCVALTHS
jgi:FtsH-binding integral membrane protein